MTLGSQHEGVAKLQPERTRRCDQCRSGIEGERSGWEGKVAQAIEAPTVNLCGGAEWIAGRGHQPEVAGGGAEHSLAVKPLGAVPPARQLYERVGWCDHTANTAIHVPE